MSLRKLQRDEPDSSYTWNTPSPLAARLEVPVAGAWRRMLAGAKRREMLESALSSQEAAQGAVIAITGPSGSGKTDAALSLADLRGLRAVYASNQTDQQALRPQAGLLVIIDPVSAYPLDQVQACLDFYAATCPVVLIDRDDQALTAIQGVQSLLRLRLPTSSSISLYLRELLTGYPHALGEQDFEQLGHAMHGLSLAQVNQVAVDAALSRLQYGQDVDRRSLDSSLQALGAMRGGGAR